MPFLHNLPRYKRLRQKLRNAVTEPEQRFWYYLRHRRFRGLKFKRQYGIGSYVVDFFCYELLLAVELDGGQHTETDTIEYDQRRTCFLNSQGIKVVRYFNGDVMSNIDSVLEDLTKVTDGLTTPRQRRPSSRRGSDPELAEGERGGDSLDGGRFANVSE
jgi:very-short-patch-repair endonuclease